MCSLLELTAALRIVCESFLLPLNGEFLLKQLKVRIIGCDISSCVYFNSLMFILAAHYRDITCHIFNRTQSGCTVVWWSAPSPHSRGFLVLNPAGSVCVESACSPRVCVGSLRVLRLPPTVQKHAVRLTGDSETVLRSECGCSSLCGPVMD